MIGEVLHQFVGLMLLVNRWLHALGMAVVLIWENDDPVESDTADPRMGISGQDLGFWITSCQVFLLSILQ